MKCKKVLTVMNSFHLGLFFHVLFVYSFIKEGIMISIPDERSYLSLKLEMPNARGFAISTLFSLVTLSSSAKLNGSGAPWEVSGLLPKNVKPESYSLLLDPKIQEGTFTGSVSISLDVVDKRDHLIIHTKDLNVTEVKLLNSIQNEMVQIKKSFEYKENEFWIILLENEISPGKYILDMDFSGNLLDKIVGFYRSQYLSDNNVTRYLVTTKFEPTYARMAFPCFDEPSFKAVFNIELVRPSGDGYIALSNMNQVGEEKDKPREGVTKVKFAPTPPMSTYLACFIVCDFHKLDVGISQNGVEINVYARPGQIQNMLYSRDLAVAALDFYVKYFSIEYPLPKLDLIAIPDFVSGAMENWGLVTFRESMILISDGVSSFIDSWSVTYTVCHELSHMWFGDIVTMAWWDDLWLNEGFATFMSVVCARNVKPEWHSEIMEIITMMNHVLEADSVISSHPIIQDVSHPDQITEIFDVISYSKSAAVLRMLYNLSPSAFREGVSSYLKKFKYRNARTEDLWESMQEKMERLNVSQVMGTWTKQTGYPLVTVTRQGNRLLLHQSRFLTQKETTFSPEDSPYKYRWDIPILYVTSWDPKRVETVLFEGSKENGVIELLEDDNQNITWYKLNWRQVGFYRVNYPEECWKELSNVLKDNPNALSAVEDRVNLIEDAFSLASGGYIKYDIPLTLAGYLNVGGEAHFAPWKVVTKHLDTLKRNLAGTPLREPFLKYVRGIVEPSLSDATWDITEKTPSDEMLRKVAILSFACALEVPEAIEKARQLLQDYLDGKSDKPYIEIRALVYKYGIIGEKESSVWEKLWQVYLNEEAPQELSKLRTALVNVRQPSTLKRFLELAKNEDYVRGQDYLFTLMHMADNVIGNDIVWDFVRNEWEYLVKRFTLNDRVLGRLIPSVTNNFATQERLAEVKSFFSKYPQAGAGASARKEAIETITNNIHWREKHMAEIENWIKENSINSD